MLMLSLHTEVCLCVSTAMLLRVQSRYATVLVYLNHNGEIVAELLHRADPLQRHVSIPIFPLADSRGTDALSYLLYDCEASGQLHSIAFVCHDLKGQYSLLTSRFTRPKNLSSSCSLRQRTQPLACPRNFHCSYLNTSPPSHHLLYLPSCSKLLQLHRYITALVSTARAIFAHTHQLSANSNCLSILNCYLAHHGRLGENVL